MPEDYTDGIPLRPKQLAAAMGRHVNFVYAIKRAGFPMPAGIASLSEAREWLAAHPGFTIQGAYRQPDEGTDDSSVLVVVGRK